MGLFDKIKNILFEDEEEAKEMPVYNKESIKKEEKAARKEPKQTAPSERKAPVPIRVHIPDEEPKEVSRFKDIKKEIDIDEIAATENFPSTRMSQYENEEVKKIEKPVVEQRSVFQSFDEEEFERINSPKTTTETRIKKDAPSLRRTNSYTEAVNHPTETKHEPHGRKPFRPSPVISPVYGILDKNYSKEDIVDRQNSLTREKINPIVYTPDIKKEKVRTEEEYKEADIDSIRKKAYGENLVEIGEREVEEKDLPAFVAVKEDYEEEDSYDEEPNNDVIDNSSLDEIVDNHFKNAEEKTTIPVEEEIEEEQEENFDEPELPIMPREEREEIKYPKALDDIEKTSTLQILDDIEKELNAIKPSSKSDQDEEEEVSYKEDTLENDLFNLIDSMYEKGEEENND